jgi:hypothetical protein
MNGGSPPAHVVYEPAKAAHQPEQQAVSKQQQQPDSFWSQVGILVSNPQVVQLLLQCLAVGFGAGIIGSYQ